MIGTIDEQLTLLINIAYAAGRDSVTNTKDREDKMKEALRTFKDYALDAILDSTKEAISEAKKSTVE